ncbi:MAG TPA: TonB-dependent receptor, partial [Sphingomonadales bacterium]
VKDKGGRAALLWQPGSRLSVRLEGIYQDSDPEDGDAWNPALGKFRRASLKGEGRPSTLWNGSLSVDYAMEGFADLVSVTSYQKTKTAVRAEQDERFEGLPLFADHDPWTSRFVVQEMRLVSNAPSDFEWLLGAFFIDRRTEVDFLLHFAESAPGLAIDRFFDSHIVTRSRELAGYGDAEYRLHEHWKLSAGLRLFETRVSYAEPHRKLYDTETGSLESFSFRNEGTDRDVTWRAALAFEPRRDVMLYAGFSKGYRIGQVNPNQGPSAVDPGDVVIPRAFEPDSTLNYEIGVKSAWADNRLVANLALYYIDWSNIQIDARRASDGRNYIVNAGAAVSKGLELELRALPLEGLELGLALTLQDTEITHISAVGSARSGAARGDRLPGDVGFKIAGHLSYSRAAFGDAEAYFRLDAQHVGSSPNGFKGLAGAENPFYAVNEAYENIDAAAGIAGAGWDLSVYCENLTNNSDFIYHGGAILNPVNSLRPRTFGLRLGFSY